MKERTQSESVKLVSRIKFNPTKNKKRKPGKSGREEELKKTHCCDCHPISAGFQFNSSSFLSSWIRWTKGSDMEFVQKFTPPDFKVKNFIPSISPYFNSFSGKKHTK